MLYKSNLVYVAEDNGFDYDDFSKYCFANYSQYVWRVFDGVEYCHANDAKFLSDEYREWKEMTNAAV